MSEREISRTTSEGTHFRAGKSVGGKRSTFFGVTHHAATPVAPRCDACRTTLRFDDFFATFSGASENSIVLHPLFAAFRRSLTSLQSIFLVSRTTKVFV